jgi:hypothetical protein
MVFICVCPLKENYTLQMTLLTYKNLLKTTSFPLVIKDENKKPYVKWVALGKLLL